MWATSLYTPHPGQISSVSSLGWGLMQCRFLDRSLGLCVLLCLFSCRDGEGGWGGLVMYRVIFDMAARPLCGILLVNLPAVDLGGLYMSEGLFCWCVRAWTC